MKQSIANSAPTGNPLGADTSSDGRHPDDVTILKSRDGLRQTKLIRADGRSESAVNETYFHRHYERVASLTATESLLRQLVSAQTCFVIRGRAIDAVGEVHRRKWAGDGATLEDVPRNWIMVDIDKPVCDVPEDWQENPAELVQEIITKALPDAFHGAGVVWQWSSSMGVKPGVVKAHLWFRLDTAIDSKTAKRWLSPWGMYLDEIVFQTGQPHYTATPVFIGMTDPVHERIGMIDGPDVIVPSIGEIVAFPDFVGGKRIVGHGYEHYRAQIGIQGFHMAMLSAVGAFISKNWPEPDVEWLRGDLRQHILTCDAPGRTQLEREHRAGDHLDKLIEWTMQRQAENSERQNREIDEFAEIMRAEIEADGKRPAGSDMQRKFFGDIGR